MTGHLHSTLDIHARGAVRPGRVGPRSAVSGTGRCLPSRVFRNDEFPESLNTSDEWIRTRTGILERRLSGSHETSYTLGLEASRLAIEAAGLHPTDIDLIICATVTPETLVPCNAARFQGALGCRPIGSFDVSGACTGFIHALMVADQFINAGTCKHVLVVGAEVLTRTVDFTDRAMCILFGDGGGALVLSATHDPGRGLRWARVYSDGARGDLIRMPSTVTNTVPVLGDNEPPETPLLWLTLNGREVFRFAVRALVGLVREALESAPPPPGSRLFLVPHQVNQRILDAALAELKMDPAQVAINLSRYGNTSAASIPMALDEAVREGRIQQGDHILFAAFGGGLSWGGVMMTY